MIARTSYAFVITIFLGSALAIPLGGCSDGAAKPTNLREPPRHRPQAPACFFDRGPEPAVPGEGECAKHADCAKQANGACVDSNAAASPVPIYRCDYDRCGSDADCAPNELCNCAEGGKGTCLRLGNCRIDADCGSSSYCARAYDFDCDGRHALGSYYCRTQKDTCVEDRDCPSPQYCDYDAIDGRWECKSPSKSCLAG